MVIVQLKRRLPFLAVVGACCIAWYGVYRWRLEQELNPLRWQAQIQAFERRDETNPPPVGGILFVGGSSIRLWNDLKLMLTNHAVFRRGFGGAELDEVIQYADRIILPYAPSMVMVYAGDNDLAANKSPDEVLTGFQQLVQVLHGEQPDMEIVFLAIKPSPTRITLLPRIREVNLRIQEFVESNDRLYFLDMHSPLLNSNGFPRVRLFRPDGLHLNDQGYRVWARILGQFLDQQAARDGGETEPPAGP